MKSSPSLRWIESGGGPLLLLPQDLLGFWEGIGKPPAFRTVSAEFRWQHGDQATDYDRACDIKSYVGLLGVGPGTGLVLGDEPLPTTWVGLSDGNDGILARWVYADSDAQVAAVLERLPTSTIEWENEVVLPHDGGPVVLFDAAAPGRDVRSESFTFDLSSGLYQVATARMERSDEISLLLHRLKLR